MRLDKEETRRILLGGLDKKMSRREALLSILALTTSGKVIYDAAKDVYSNHLIWKIYNEVPKHVHVADSNTRGFLGLDSFRGAGIIVDQNYITPAHCIGEVSDDDYDMINVETKLYGKKLKKSYISKEDDLAVFELPSDLHLPNFPCEVSNEVYLGDEVYIIGNPYLEGANVRKTNVSRVKRLPQDFGKKIIGLDKKLIPGDSGTPTVNKDFKLIGMNIFVKDGLGYCRRLGEYFK